ncbi:MULTISPECIES: hypothetical protein [Bacillus]|uniref:hypothetical protein n=1 Tax=Bacillus TaxID=1386 RepID=UPI000C780B95|nr:MULTISPECIES: hypothetical protein [Bacillus]MCA1035739.1 hypothetical protein [Bacillus infantis]PLR71071.1 hypothetical protein CYJ37_20005 [Bacillus sp. UMB0728]RYI26684.1 hypothetical protein EVU96_20185 [Bacillus infantis]
MRDILGYFLIAQAILTGVIVYSINSLSDSIKASAAYVATTDRDKQLSWGSDLGMPSIALFLLIAVAGLGIFLVVNKKGN